MEHGERCKRLVAAIQNLEHAEITELFKLLHANKCEYTRNNNGVFINLSWLPDDMLTKIETYVAFCTKSKNEVKHYESLCDVLNKGINEQLHEPHSQGIDVLNNIGDIALKTDRRQAPARISSSMRFYLLKKRFSKQTPISTSAKSDLKNEEYVLP